MAFVQKTVRDEEAFGPDLRELRERAGLSRPMASFRTKIPISVLRAWEEDDWQTLDGAAYLERLFRSYIQFLKGNEAYFIGKYHLCLQRGKIQRKEEDFLPRPLSLRLWDFTVSARIFTWFWFGFFVLLLSGYVYVQVRAISVPPPLRLDEPIEGQTLRMPMASIHGKTLPEASVVINGQTIIVQPDGVFASMLAIPRGTTVIAVMAKKRHSQASTIIRHVIYDRPLPALDFSSASSSIATATTTDESVSSSAKQK